MFKKILFFIFIWCSLSFFGQTRDTLAIKNGIDKPSMVPIHPFGIFSARINQNFRTKPVSKSTLSFTYASANTFHPFVEQYIPKDQATRNELRQLIWYNRRYYQDQQTTPSEYSNIIIDGVYKNFRVDFNTKISKNHELGITLRSYLITKGKYPFSTISSDEFIEWFHSNIAGGEDPFGRRFYGLNQVNIRYQDRDGNILEQNNGDFFVGGLEVNHFYYPDFKTLKKKNIFVNFGSHLGINLSQFNPSLDIGVSGNLIKEWVLKNKNEIRSSFGSAYLRKNIVNFGEVINFGNNNFFGSLEAMVEFTKYTRKNNYHAFGVNYQRQTSFFKRDEANYYQLVGEWQAIHSGWENGFEKLHEQQSSWSIIYTYARKKYLFSIYVKQDLYLNNSPDIQTGAQLQIPISN
ncbi:hypothetical protein [uncultured Polaribacter sp.]|uniref:hypothetical protein n=1 Tax=uncultured Polaribacter sp. TaxID=174711 RepID=UPI00261CAA68|nr:hypothetical protein [uncultured Polaribacter sp.]